jgi:hypothetical protein
VRIFIGSLADLLTTGGNSIEKHVEPVKDCPWIAQLYLKTINMWKKLMISLNGIMKSNDSGRRVKDGFKMGV